MQDKTTVVRPIKWVTTEDLKAMWDHAFENEEEFVGPFSCEEIHTELNRRGEGKYCAV